MLREYMYYFMARNNPGDGRGSLELHMILLSALSLVYEKMTEKGICIIGKGRVQCYLRTNIALLQGIC